MFAVVMLAVPGAAPRLVFNNDLTNIESCSSPFHRGTATTGQPFTLAMLKAAGARPSLQRVRPAISSAPVLVSANGARALRAVEETAGLGFDVHELAPGCCYVPWWNNSTLISIPEHVHWWTHTFYRKDGSLPPNRTEG
jgi:hypothetical protein